ncbi:SAM-dependent methyltransferase [Candidatus Bealeia paramacronuclearis]|uniref:SAM-dependent methyltransferase n=1 Tax=Candidatus Bealeia paramacronuclearis TaxID=1921001 RepID=A0ABZ2C4Z1_9PROT|nr:SAM-dependent methyltransferase [Candidatus Bealeia paramacronuclearis]
MKHLLQSDALATYIQRISRGEALFLEQLRRETQKLPEAHLQITSEQGRFLSLLVELTDSRRILEVGTFTGYSSLVMGLSLPKDGHLITLDTNPEWTKIAQQFWELAGVSSKMELRLGHAVDSLKNLIEEGQTCSFDLMFIDADKQRYDVYYEFALTLLRSHGTIVIDNVLWSGRVADPKNHEVTTESLRAFNEKLMNDDRVSISLVPLGDGFMVAKKRY